MYRNHKDKIRIVILLLVLFVLSGSIPHKFYVSLTEIQIRPEKGKLEISMRIFPDDLDLAIMASSGVNPQLSTELEHKDADKWLDEYIHKFFSISINSEEMEFTYIGKEPESDAIWCYLEADYTGIPKDIQVKNSILTDQFRDQKNIVQVYFNKYNKGMLLDAYNSSGSLSIE